MAPTVAGTVYATAWLTGLLIGPPALSVAATGGEVVSAYAGHQGPAIGQVVLTEGVAGLALAVVVLALGQVARCHGARRLASRIEIAGFAAVGLSLVQCVLGLLLAGWAAPADDSARAGALFELVSRIDGAKMLLLAAVAVSASGLAGRGVFPAWAVWPSGVLAVALTVSGFGYLLLSPALAWAAYVSLPVLLVWVAGAGILSARLTPSPA